MTAVGSAPLPRPCPRTDIMDWWGCASAPNDSAVNSGWKAPPEREPPSWSWSLWPPPTIRMENIMAKPVVRILLVDDHFVVRTGLRAILEDEPDLSVLAEAEDGRQAVE